MYKIVYFYVKIYCKYNKVYKNILYATKNISKYIKIYFEINYCYCIDINPLLMNHAIYIR